MDIQMESEKKNEITEGVIWKRLLLFFFPIAFGTFFQQLYNTADTVVVGRFVGKEALACVGGSSSQMINLVVGFFVGLSSGAAVVISQYYGAKNRERTNRTLYTCLIFALAGGIVLSILGLALAPAVLRAMKTPENLMGDSVLYVRIYFAGILFVFLYNIGASILRAIGDSKSPFYFLVVCCVINVALDLFFVIALDMGVAGVAIATLIAQAVSAVLVLWAIRRKKDVFDLEWKKIAFHSRSLGEIIRLGLPAGIQSMMYSISNVMIQSALNQLGTDSIAAWTSYGKIDAFFWMLLSAFGISITTFVGQNYGAKRYDRMRRSVWICLGMSMGTAVAISLILLFAGKYLFYIFTDDMGVIDIGMEILRYMVPAYFLYVFIEILSGALRGMGDVIIPMIMTCVGVCVLRIVWIQVAVPIWPTIRTIIFSYPLTWAITAVMFIFYYHRRQKRFS